MKAIRLGFRQITGFRGHDAEAIFAARQTGAKTLSDIARRAGLSRAALERLAEADALRSLGVDRRDGLWAVKGLGAEIAAAPAPLTRNLDLFEDTASLPTMALPVHVAEDYRTVGLSLKEHPCRFFRPSLARRGVVTAEMLKGMKDGAKVSVAGLVLNRQRPGTSKGVVFMTLEDETGVGNIVIWKDIFQANRRLVMTTGFVIVHGRLQSHSNVIHVVAESFTNLSDQLQRMKLDPDDWTRKDGHSRLQPSRDFH